MTIDEKIKMARRLMREVTIERRDEKKAEMDNMVCKCGHKHIEHTHSLSINYTAGFCDLCDCENFLTNN